MLIRSKDNPIIIAQPELSWCSKKVYNCAVHFEDGIYRMLLRGIGDDWISRIGLAESQDGVRFSICPEPVLTPLEPWEAKGCEDPRMVKIDETYYVTYTAYDGITARAAMVSTRDFHNWQDRRLLFPDWDQTKRENLPSNWSKAAALFPQKIDGVYYLFFGDSHIWAASSNDLQYWTPTITPILSARVGQADAGFVEMGPPPIMTPKGWLVLYHGINNLSDSRTYVLEAALFETDNPLHCLWRRTEPILVPTESYEVGGMVDTIPGGFETLKNLNESSLRAIEIAGKIPRAVFCCGAVLKGKQIELFYSGGDTVICTAKVDLDTVFESLNN